MNRIPSALKGGVRVTPYPEPSKKSKTEENERGQAANEHSCIGKLDTPNARRAIRVLTKELGPVADHPLTDEEANFSDDSCHSVLFPILNDECLSPIVSSEVEEFPLDFAADASPFDETADDYLPLSQLTQRPVSLSPSPVDDDRVSSTFPLENTSEITHQNSQTLDLGEIRGGVLSADGRWVFDPEPTNGTSYRYKLKNIVSENSVEFSLEFDSPPSKKLVSNPVFLTRNGKEWFVYAGEKSIYLYLLENSNTIKNKLKYKIENITALTISQNGKYFSVASDADKERAVFIWKINEFNDFYSPEKILSKFNKFKIKNISLSPDKKLIAVAGIEGANKHIIYIFSVESERECLALPERAASIECMAFEQAGESYIFRVKYFNNPNYFAFSINLNASAKNEPRRILAQDSLAEEDFSLSQINNLG